MNDELFQIDTPPSKGRANLKGGEFCYRRNLLCITNNLCDLLEGESGVAIHELTHFLQHCSTPYGFFLDELNARRIELTLQLLHRQEGAIKTPVYDWARLLWNSPDEYGQVFDQVAQRILSYWSATFVIEQILEGNNTDWLRGSTIGKALNSLAICEQSLATLEENESISMPFGVVATEEECAKYPLPHINYAETDGGEISSYPFGALHLSEGVAQSHEGYESIFERVGGHNYLLAIGAFFARFKANVSPGPNWKSPAIKATLFTLLDLAFFTPLGNVYGKLRRGDMQWRDLHPGYRFLRSIDVISKKSLWISSFAESEHLANAICETLRWPKPREFLEIGARLSNHTLGARHALACRSRLEDFMTFYDLEDILDQTSPIAKFFAHHAPMIANQDGTFCSQSEGIAPETGPLAQVRTFFLGQFAWNIMGEEYGIESEFIPSDFLFERYFENIASVEDFWKMFAGKRPWAARSRFEVL